LKKAAIYELLGEIDLNCEMLNSAIHEIPNETRPDHIEIKKIIQEKIIAHCKL